MWLGGRLFTDTYHLMSWLWQYKHIISMKEAHDKLLNINHSEGGGNLYGGEVVIRKTMVSQETASHHRHDSYIWAIHIAWAIFHLLPINLKFQWAILSKLNTYSNFSCHSMGHFSVEWVYGPWLHPSYSTESLLVDMYKIMLPAMM